ncbi:cytochrome P450 [Coniophora puteana RWD-64-598 SS2]|uniref:Cytochrome P450 n=1 Tax=Coniophora puteana (strain RWD-64-598) TaxID=741705 RepID=A0A5M3MXA7_CONPW|nr:cytochrome P450 [Coniophora puteana RWD-64-598 SS2]EIW83716.1 cytochrome P450 [Coniophora puteana RWD-64-598 SS2]
MLLSVKSFVDDFWAALLVAVTAVLLTVYGLQRTKANNSQCPLPPGPRPLPFIGSLLELDRLKPYKTYTAWGKKYGEIMSCRILGKLYVVVSSERIARALVDKKSNIYADRPFIATNKMFGMDFNTAHLRYGDRWRAHRRVFHQTFRSEVISKYHPIQTTKAHALLYNILESPQDFFAHSHLFVTSVIMAIMYGYNVTTSKDPAVKRVERLLDLVISVLTPERAAILGAFPLLKRIPPWFPGAKIQRTAAEARVVSKDVQNIPLRWTKEQMATGKAPPSMVSDFLEQISGDRDRDYQEAILRECATSAYIAGTDSTESTFLNFVMAMILYPDVQMRAQADIDAWLGSTRLPTLEDRDHLPYIEAIFREAKRWSVVVPLAVPHVATGDQVFEGYFIPKGAGVITNMYAMSKDASVYPDPETFKPERFLTPSGALSPDFADIAFGFGRRVCPGRYLSDASVWIAIACVLSCFRIGKAVDAQGRDIEVVPRYKPGLAM